jgi:hypothetical protein
MQISLTMPGIAEFRSGAASKNMKLHNSLRLEPRLASADKKNSF